MADFGDCVSDERVFLNVNAPWSMFICGLQIQRAAMKMTRQAVPPP